MGYRGEDQRDGLLKIRARGHEVLTTQTTYDIDLYVGEQLQYSKPLCYVGK